jgi:hypothetical protein
VDSQTEDSTESLTATAPSFQEKGGSPIGLLNLGATCYMNVLLQCLFMNPTFRQGIYDYTPDNGVRYIIHSFSYSLKEPARSKGRPLLANADPVYETPVS